MLPKWDKNLVNLLLTTETKQDAHSHQPAAPRSTPELQDEVIELLPKYDKKNKESRPTTLQSAAGAGHELVVRLLQEEDETSAQILVKSPHYS